MSAPIYDLPIPGFRQISFDLIVPQHVNRMRGRRTEGRLVGTPYWTAQYQFTSLVERDSGQAEAWIRKLSSRGGVFRAYDMFRPRPIEFGRVAPGLTWTAGVTSIVNARSIVISGVANNAQFREGDYVAFKMSDLIVSLHSIAADVQANGSGAVTISIDPALDTQNFTTAADAIFEKPYCLMQPFGWSCAKGLVSAEPSFSAHEVFFYEIGEEE